MSGWVNDWKVGECMGEQKLVCERERQCERQRASLTWYTSNSDIKFQTLPPPALARDPLPRTAKSLGAVSRASFKPAAPASRCHVGHRSYMCPIFRVYSSFSSVIRRKRRKKHAVQHCPRQNLFTWASMFISALVNVLLGALQQQQQQRVSTIAPNCYFWRVVGRTWCTKHAAGHCLRKFLITWASMLISALLNVPLRALLHMSGCGHMVCYGRIVRRPCVAAARYPICQRPLSDACQARAAQHCQPHATWFCAADSATTACGQGCARRAQCEKVPEHCARPRAPEHSLLERRRACPCPPAKCFQH